MRRPKWTQVVVVCGLIAAVAMAVPAFGLDKSIKRAIKKEVAKQVANAQGPAGATGATGAPGAAGAAGAAGTAVAYARVVPHANATCTPNCTFDNSKGIVEVTRINPGSYCVVAPGVEPASSAPVVTIDQSTTGFAGDTTAVVGANSSCSGASAGAGHPVTTYRHPTVAVRSANDLSTTEVIDSAVVSDNVGFTVVFP